MSALVRLRSFNQLIFNGSNRTEANRMDLLAHIWHRQEADAWQQIIYYRVNCPLIMLLDLNGRNT